MRGADSPNSRQGNALANILLVDDDDDLRPLLGNELAARGHSVTQLDGAEPAPALLAHRQFDVVLLDNIMPRMTGIEFLKTLREHRIQTPVILMTGNADSDTAIRAINLGAFEYVIKPAGDIESLVQELEPVITRALGIKPPKEVHVPGQSKSGAGDGPKLIGNSKVMRKVYTRIGQVADTDFPVLIRGETGTGKELVAQALHNFSARKDKPFVALNVPAIPENLLESELFGHERGAFTGAETVRKGMIEHANGGTLFLDEIGDMPLALQSKLLRVLQERQIVRIGSSDASRPIKVDFRLLSATRRNLELAIHEGKFRDDLYYRLKGVEIELPPLRERLEDLPQLVEYFLAQEADRCRRARPAVNHAALERLCAHRWPGNIRELQGAIRAAFTVCSGQQILPADLDLSPVGGPMAPTAESEGAYPKRDHAAAA
jgi:two-component system, NtrC family, response regulator AtoC